MDKDFLTVRDIAAILDLSERTVRGLFNSGELKGRKVAGKYVTTKELLKKFIEGEGREGDDQE